MLRHILRAANLLPDAPVLLCGVVPEAVSQLERELKKRHGLKVWRFRKNLPCPLQIIPQPNRNVGDDRLAGALGALALDPTRPWVIIDGGTALTINSVRPSKGKWIGVFEGGLIIPGEALALRALGCGTAQLPEVEPWPENRVAPVLGRTTSEALRSGVRRAQIAAAAGLALAQAKALGPRTRVIITGGGGRALWPALRLALHGYSPFYSPDLIQRGLFKAYKNLAGPASRRP